MYLSVLLSHRIDSRKDWGGGEKQESSIQSFLLEIMLFWYWHVKDKSLDELMVAQFDTGKMPSPGKI